MMGNYPWFATFNYLQKNIPQQDTALKQNARNAAIGMCASIVSDCISNSLRVVKAVKQTSGDANLGYMGAVNGVLEKDGMKGLFVRGLSTRITTNVLQAMVFSVAWKGIEAELNKRLFLGAPAFLVGFLCFLFLLSFLRFSFLRQGRALVPSRPGHLRQRLGIVEHVRDELPVP